MGKLVLLRHGKSEWNKLGKWTGWTDVNLTEEGEADAKRAGHSIADITFDEAFTAPLIRTKETLRIALEEAHQTVPTEETKALLERNYGIYTGKNKWEIKEELGEDEFHELRRGWDYPIPEGETMEDVYNRVRPFYDETILPHLKEGKQILVTASGNSLRALVMYIEKLSIDALKELEIGLGEVYVYEISDEGEIVSKEIRAENEARGTV